MCVLSVKIGVRLQTYFIDKNFMVLRYRLFLWGICGFSLISCSEPDNLTDNDFDNEENEENVGDKDVRIFMSVPSIFTESRASISEELVEPGKPLPLRWDDGDRIRMLVGEDSINMSVCDFELKDIDNSGTAHFEYSGRNIFTDYYCGVYPATDISLSGSFAFSVPLDGSISQSADDDSRHLSNYRVMFTPYIENKSADNELANVTFKHLTSLVVFNIENNSGKDLFVKSIKLKAECAKPVFHSKASFNLFTSEYFLSETDMSDSFKLSFSGDGLNLKDGVIGRGYMPLIPSDNFDGATVLIEAELADGKIVKSIVPSSVIDELKNFQAGTYCMMNIIFNNEGITVGSEFESWEDGGAIEVPLNLVSG